MIVRRINEAVSRAEQIPAAMQRAGVEFAPIAVNNWREEYAYSPRAEFRIAHTGDAILLHYKVSEQSVRALHTQDNGKVWTDSCAEFFFSPVPGDDTYYNLECNCCGTVLLGGGKMRPDRHHASAESLQQIDRWTTMGREGIDVKTGDCTWELALRVPTEVFFLHKIETLDGLEAAANFYKCGDELPTPHYLSWQRIDAPHPNFHLPEFFGQLSFAKN